MLLLIDNYDSFTYNLMQYFAALGQQVMVRRNDDISVVQIRALAPEYLVISPGPKTPDDAGISLQAIEYFAGKLPILGVCLGHQAIAQVFGAKVERARQVMHGKNSLVQHNNSSVFVGLENPLDVTRYHSLVVQRESLPNVLQQTAWTYNVDGQPDEIMGLVHQELPIHGVQFHPEAILSQQGKQLLSNFLQCSVPPH
ncbi:aminodeoxychorismate/anthranilate synthase component II [Rheinheimera baltica]|uniref:anthranilate synthase component II n=2 Tax=Rheinheimera baltica TaxID=67576 RepID=UPI00273D45F9|nr:aminodeoxychorismate/anthranilate synthase component II [Rheinheimera baltica]MDP5144312.1 aminodeoxychorismate/anthranilate synthase component II [Rheinheimera baltica]MDP5151470.1 aminodeoxychorismate/anthranilate synthase component II [Rheinheimera baltica]